MAAVWSERSKSGPSRRPFVRPGRRRPRQITRGSSEDIYITARQSNTWDQLWRPFICSRRRPRRVLSPQLSWPPLVTPVSKLVAGPPLLLRPAVPPSAALVGFCGGKMSLLITMVTAASFVPGSSGDRKKSPHFQVPKNVSPSYAASEGHSPDTSIGPGSLCGAPEFELFIASLIPRYRLRPPSSPRQKNRAPPQKRQWARSLIRWAIIWWRRALSLSLSLDRPACLTGRSCWL